MCTHNSKRAFLSYNQISTRPIAILPAMAATNNAKFAMLLYLLFISFVLTISDDAADVKTLHLFKDSILDPLGSLSSWNSNTGPCQWKGIICQKGQIFILQLEKMGLSGPLDLDVLTSLPFLRSISFNNNNFSGPLPDLKNFQGLKNVYFSSNKFDGEIPDDAFDGMRSLKTVDLSVNGFTGTIPSSLAGVNTLTGLLLNDNGFVGEIPDFEQPDLLKFNVSNNNLEGRIPDKLSKLDPSNFSGNKNLCGQPTKLQCEESTNPDPQPSSSHHKRLSPRIIVAIAAATGLVLFIIIIAILVLGKKSSKKNKKTPQARSLEKPNKLNPATIQNNLNQDRKGKKPMPVVNERDHGKLVFLNEERTQIFDLQDLLKASAEVLGGGELGSSYKAILIDGPAVVVKRYKEMDRVGKEDFHGYMTKIGRLSHPNLLPILAYHSRKGEKLMVTEFVPYGSLANMLHGNRTAENPALDWQTRLKIVKGITRGLSYLYEELSTSNAPHGHLKSSNVLLSENYEPLLTDYGLIPLVNQSHSSQKLIAFKSPECKQSGRVSRKSDVWSLGVLILEILTGKYPGNYTRNAQGGSDLSNWVNSVVREEWTGEVFDGEMKRTRRSEGEMLNMLQIGMGCCEMDVNKRWDMRDVVEKIEDLKEIDDDDDGYSSMASEGDGYSSRGGVTEDDFSFSTNNPGVK